MKAALLPDRGVVKVAGEDARKFLNGLLTTDIAQGDARPGRVRGAAHPAGQDHGRHDRRRGAGRGRRRLLPRLPARARPDAHRPAQFLQAARQGDGRGSVRGARRDGDLGRTPRDRIRPVLRRPAPARARDAAACCRLTSPRKPPPISARRWSTPSEYEAHRIALGAPRGGLDFHYNDAFPHEADMDQLGGIDFDKGCYVGQEVVSRVEHRGTARKRVVPVTFADFGPEAGVAVRVGETEVGVMGSSANGRGLAMLHLGRVGDALAAGTPIMCRRHRAASGASRTGRDSTGRAKRRRRSNPTMAPVLHPDGLHRCPWPGQDPFYVAYHDDEWGVPEYDDRALYEKLDPRRFPGRAVVDHDPAQAREFPPRLRRLPAGKDRPLHAEERSSG